MEMSQQDFQEKTKNKNGRTNDEGENVGQKIKDQYDLKTLRRNW
jgi:hypothetical protein